MGDNINMIFSIFDKDSNIIGIRELKGSYELSAWSNTVKLFEIQKMIFTDVIYRKNHFNAL